MECLEVTFQCSEIGHLSEWRGKVIPCGGPEDRKGAGNKNGKSGTRTLQAEGTGSRLEGTGGCVQLKIVVVVNRFYTALFSAFETDCLRCCRMRF